MVPSCQSNSLLHHVCHFAELLEDAAQSDSVDAPVYPAVSSSNSNRRGLPYCDRADSAMVM